MIPVVTAIVIFMAGYGLLKLLSPDLDACDCDSCQRRKVSRD